MKNLKNLVWDRALTVLILLAYSGKKYPFVLLLMLTSASAFGQRDWLMLDLNETARFTTTQQYCDHLKIVYKKSLASDNKDANCPCEWARVTDFPAPPIGDRLGKALLRLFSAKDLGLSNEQLDLEEMNRRADSLGYEICTTRIPLRLLELMKQDPALFAGHTDLIVPIQGEDGVEFTRVNPGNITTKTGEWLPGSNQKRAWLRDVMYDDQNFVYRKK